MSPSKKSYNVLFLCTGNSARSIFAEAILAHWGGPKFNAHSAGSHPTGVIHPLTLEVLRRFDLPTGELRSKSWDEFTVDGSEGEPPTFDFVFTVCDRARDETCPRWVGQPLSAHWGISDPAAVSGDDLTKIQAFRRAFAELENRIRLFIELPIDSLDSLKIQQEIDRIGQITP